MVKNLIKLIGVLLVVNLVVFGCSSESGNGSAQNGGDTDVDERSGGELNPNGVLRGLFVDPLRHISQPDAELAAYVQRLAQNGYTTIVVPYLMQLDWTVYPTESEQLTPYKENLNDWVDTLLKAADSVGVEVFLGLTRERRLEHYWEDNPAEWEVNRLKALVADYENRYGDYESYAGVYLHWETPAYLSDTRHDRQIKEVLSNFIPFLHDYYPKRKVAIRIRYPGMPITEFASAPEGTWKRLEEFDDSEFVQSWAREWMEFSEQYYIDMFVVEAENGTGRNSVAKASAIANALDSLRGSSSTHIAVLVDLFTTLPSQTGVSMRKQVAVFSPDWNAISELAANLPEGAVLWGFDESFIADVPEQEADKGFPQEVIVKLQDSSVWVENHLERSFVRDGMLITVGATDWDIDRGLNIWQEDSCWLTGLYLAALSFEADTTGNERTYKKARYFFNSLIQQAKTTPLEGEVVRNLVFYLYHQNDPVPPDSDTIKRWHKYPSQDKEWYWVGDISVDQLSGYFYGIAIYYDLIADESEKAVAAQTFSKVAKLIIQNDWHAKEYTGLNTTYGNLNLEPILAFDLASIAYHFTNDRYFLDAYTSIVEQGFTTSYFKKLALLLYMPGQANFQHFVDAGFYHVLQYAHVPQIYGEVQYAMKYIYQRSFFYGFAWGDLNFALFDPKAEGLTRAVWELYEFNPRYLDLRRWYAEVNQRFDSGFVPMRMRPANEYEWHTNLDKQGGELPRGGPTMQFTGVGFLTAYWFGRWHQLIPGITAK